MAVTTPTDVALVRAMADRDEGALRLLYERHAGWLLARLRRRCADREVVADVVQDTFVAAWEGARGFREEGQVAGWLWGIAIHRLVTRLRRRGAQELRLGPALLERDSVDMSAEDRVLLAVEHTDVGAAVTRMSPELRVVLQVTILDGLTTREAASLLRIPQGTVKTRLARARATLREELS
jgi:RNA polymerase sigma-70 factor (ECF subfamily)